MNKADFLAKLAEVLEVEEDGIDEGFELNEDTMDSVAILGVIALIDEEYDLTVPTAALKECGSVRALVELVAQAQSPA